MKIRQLMLHNHCIGSLVIWVFFNDQYVFAEINLIDKVFKRIICLRSEGRYIEDNRFGGKSRIFCGFFRMMFLFTYSRFAAFLSGQIVIRNIKSLTEVRIIACEPKLRSHGFCPCASCGERAAPVFVSSVW